MLCNKIHFKFKKARENEMGMESGDIIYSVSTVCCFIFREMEQIVLFRTVCIWVGKGILAKDLYAFMQKFYKLAREFVLSMKNFHRIDPVYKLRKIIVFTQQIFLEVFGQNRSRLHFYEQKCMTLAPYCCSATFDSKEHCASGHWIRKQ